VGEYWAEQAIIKVVPVQEMPRPPGNTNPEVVVPLASMCADTQVGGFLVDGVDPRCEHQEATVVCPNHKSSADHHDLVGKAHAEENEAGRNSFRRPGGAFSLW
jgi:hypothetical protein